MEEVKIPSFRVDNKVALITGGSRGIGKACAFALANAGAEIIILGRNENKLAEVHREIENMTTKVLSIPGDLTEISQTPKIVHRILNQFKRIDILVNNAGVCYREAATDISEETWNNTMNVNLKGLFFLTKEVAKNMIKDKYGRIINISSMNSITALVGHTSYNCSKAGLIGLTKVLAMEWGRYGINVNSVSPTFTKTEMAEHVMQNKNKYNEIIKNIPLGRLAETYDIAAAVLFLASPAADFITGINLLVDGGWTTGKELRNI